MVFVKSFTLFSVLFWPNWMSATASKQRDRKKKEFYTPTNTFWNRAVPLGISWWNMCCLNGSFPASSMNSCLCGRQVPVTLGLSTTSNTFIKVSASNVSTVNIILTLKIRLAFHSVNTAFRHSELVTSFVNLCEADSLKNKYSIWSYVKW